jgi:preprotein translocase subunit YajC
VKDYWSILYLVALIGIFYVMVIRPQQQRQKKHQQTIESLVPNMDVTTYGGILGTIVKVKDKTIILKIADNVKIEVLKSAIADSNTDEDKSK